MGVYEPVASVTKRWGPLQNVAVTKRWRYKTLVLQNLQRESAVTKLREREALQNPPPPEISPAGAYVPLQNLTLVGQVIGLHGVVTDL